MIVNQIIKLFTQFYGNYRTHILKSGMLGNQIFIQINTLSLECIPFFLTFLIT